MTAPARGEFILIHQELRRLNQRLTRLETEFRRLKEDTP